ncbi:peptidoglycan DD-metalloendopeptidase family protein [Streptomyces sp. NPDC059874]|uniref:peptidoglycan DD-metalloendopeptidase family protein n=1 Tax=Streptomyces sp. NPDC059874 TaxID=3346983 RepID=UPI003668AC61
MSFPSGRHARRNRTRALAGLVVAGIAAPAAVALMAQPAAAASAGTWDKVAQCESTGNWSINTGNGYYGGLQFSSSTWAEFGGKRYAPQANQATKAQQMAVAEKVLAVQGPGAWPSCGKAAGLQRGGPAPEAPVAAKQSAPAAGSSTYTVVSGDTLGRIGSKVGVDWQKLYSDNRSVIGGDPNVIMPGQRLAYGSASASASGTGTGSSKSAAPQSSKVESGSNGKGAKPVSGGSVSARYAQPGGWAAGHHTGIDFAVPTGTPVKAAAAGTVVSAGWQGSYGNVVVIKHDDGRYSLSAHLSKAGASAGQRVSAGQQIGLSGNTGNSTGPHLHFEVRAGNTYGADINPVSWLAKYGVSL